MAHLNAKRSNPGAGNTFLFLFGVAAQRYGYLIASWLTNSYSGFQVLQTLSF